MHDYAHAMQCNAMQVYIFRKDQHSLLEPMGMQLEAPSQAISSFGLVFPSTRDHGVSADLASPGPVHIFMTQSVVILLGSQPSKLTQATAKESRRAGTVGPQHGEP